MDLRSQLQDHLGDAFRIERELGGGGMSRVFQATEVRLSRSVVIKVLSPELAQGLNAERFEREILMAASLQQANIVPVLAAGDVAGLPYFTMPYVDGESLRARIGRGLPIDEVITILRDVTRALAYAHQRGIVHRDIKPDNVLLSGGTAVVTDFGIAKALSASRTDGGGNATLTSVGTSIGTPAYMAPEQVAGDPHLDHRVDLYALGCMAFEMLTGKSPFGRHAPQRMLAAHLSEAPASVESLRPDCPPALALLVARLLEKDPADRIGTASEVTQALGAVATTSSESSRLSPQGRLIRSLAIWAASTLIVWIVAKAAVVGIGLPSWTVPGAVAVMLLGLPVLLATGWAKWMARRASSATPTLTPGGSTAPSPGGTMATIAIRANRHLSFRRVRHGGMIAMASFVVLVAGFMAMRALGIGPAGSLFAAGSLATDDRILLADVTVGPGDSALAPIVQEAVRAAMSQSTAVRLVGASEVETTLGLMQRPEGTALDAAVARDVAARTNAKAILGGRLARAGDGYVLSLELSNAATGEVLASAQSSGELLSTVDHAAKALRGKIGESLRQVQRAVPLAVATTPSLEALRKYTEAAWANDQDRDFDRAIILAREALALDSTFALAWRKLGVALQNAQAPKVQSDSAIERAFRHADRLPPRERAMVRGKYFEEHSLGYDRARAIEEYRTVLAIDSLDYTALNQLQIHFTEQAEYDSAARYAMRQFQGDTADEVSGVVLVMLLQAAGRDAEAQAIRDRHLAGLTNPVARVFDVMARSATDPEDSLFAELAPLTTSPMRLIRFMSRFQRAGLQATAGRLEAARTEYLEAGQELEDRSSAGSGFALLAPAATEVAFGDPAAGVEMVRQRLASPAWRETTQELGSYVTAARILAIAGATDEADAVMTQARRVWPDQIDAGLGLMMQALVAGEVALASGRTDEAQARFRTAATDADGKPSFLHPIAQFGLARAFDAVGQADSAIAAFERYLAIAPMVRQRSGSDMLALATVRKRLGELHDVRGDRQQALRYYGQFVDQWRHADARLQPAVADVRQRMAELQRQDG